MLKQGVKFFSLFLFIFLLSGCSTDQSGLKGIDQKLGQLFSDLKNASSSDQVQNIKASVGLTKEQEAEIDSWLEKNNFNRYGDAKNAVYIGGTPLFDEKTGQSFERYSYILKKFPDILQRIKQ